MEGAKRVVNKLADEAVIVKVDTEVKFRDNSKRGKMYASIKSGMTVKEFLDANGGRAVAATYLTWLAHTAKVVKVA